MDPYGINENNYYRTWQLRNKPKNAELPPPPYHPVSTSGDGQDTRYVEHVYESPHFERREIAHNPSAVELSPTGQQYFVLDCEAEVPSHLSQRPCLADPRDTEIGWIKPDEVTFASGR